MPNKIIKSPHDNKDYFTDINFSVQDFKKLKYVNNNSYKKTRKLSKFEWKLKCLIHRIKKRILTFICWFSNCEEE